MSKGFSGVTVLGTTDPDPSKRAPAQPPHSLEVVQGVDRSWRHGSVFRMRGKELRIGRIHRVAADEPANQVVIAADTISRRHATLLADGATWSCRDEGSTGGTFVNDKRIESGTTERVFVGDRIRLGKSVTLLCRTATEAREALVRELPAPLARLESALRASAERVKRASTLFHEIDRALRFLVACTLAVLRRDAANDPLLRSSIGRVLVRDEFAVLHAHRKLTTGAWKSAFLQLSKLVKDSGTSVVASAIKLAAAEVRGIEDAIKLRNLWAHGHVPTERELEDAEPDLEALVEALFGAFAGFTSLPLVSVSRSENLVEGYRYGLHVLRGLGRARFETFECPARLLSNWCYLVDSVGDPETNAPLLLAPLVAADETREGHRVVFAERIDLGPNEQQVALEAAEGVGTGLKLGVPWLPEVAWLYESVSGT